MNISTIISAFKKFSRNVRLRHMKEEAAELRKDIRMCDEEIACAAAQKERMRRHLRLVESSVIAYESERDIGS